MDRGWLAIRAENRLQCKVQVSRLLTREQGREGNFPGREWNTSQFGTGFPGRYFFCDIFFLFLFLFLLVAKERSIALLFNPRQPCWKCQEAKHGWWNSVWGNESNNDDDDDEEGKMKARRNRRTLPTITHPPPSIPAQPLLRSE
ncbi:hypothetical protein BP00DRAFT_425060 [Aspergillus indologenus CBS 114.80]|uniref:Uncharacterized protein n=1 Tax=Aspergillus indologenus CBS 114.80 TaxID=1450541 RepID=A0A2V5I8C9_9EURO|nr:hypothetical protein BP00DRAFT_425060 [Aspergillus indologenus CBS 114.80]